MNNDFPLKIQYSFHKVIAKYEALAKSDDAVISEKSKALLTKIEPYPELKEGFYDQKLLEKYHKPIQYLLGELFPIALTDNEIKAVSIPFRNIRFNLTRRYRKILEEAGENFKFMISNMDENQMYVLGCCFILNFHYQYSVDMTIPLYMDIPDHNRVIKHYRIMYNVDLIDIFPTENAVEITQEDYELLIDNFDDIALWKAKFPPESYIAKGFGIEILFDVTTDVAISDLKTTLIENDKKNEANPHRIQNIFQAIYNIPDLRIGFTAYNEDISELEWIPEDSIKSFTLDKKQTEKSEISLCRLSYNQLFKTQKPFIVTDIDKYAETSDNHVLAHNFKTQGFKSFILAPIISENSVLAIIELASYKKFELNAVNVNKLYSILPFIGASVKRSIEEKKNKIEAIIQKECTAIHSSVYWRFQKEAVRCLRSQLQNIKPTFQEIVFENVYPLYGQVDIKGSSEARNNAIRKDLNKQLNLVYDIIEQAREVEPLSIYDELNFRIRQQLLKIKDTLNTNTEQSILNFLKVEIHPIFDHFISLNEHLRKQIAAYNTLIDIDTGVIYNKRKDYDETVTTINQHLAAIIDTKQQDAQQLFPHYFERYKTDGIDHNMYIGASLTHQKKFNTVYLYNLRLWQLQVLCEMENEYYALQPQLPVKMDVTSLILVYNSPLSIRFRMDEKIFDVDGTYNARYEIIKKRIDKAHIKGTDKRITQKGKIAVVYAQQKDAEEYMQYITFLQSKQYLDKKIEFVEVENLQGVIGLKAILVNVLYTTNAKKTYTYEELLEA